MYRDKRYIKSYYIANKKGDKVYHVITETLDGNSKTRRRLLDTGEILRMNTDRVRVSKTLRSIIRDIKIKTIIDGEV